MDYEELKSMPILELVGEMENYLQGLESIAFAACDDPALDRSAEAAAAILGEIRKRIH